MHDRVELAVKFLACTVRQSKPHFAGSLWDLWHEYDVGNTKAAQLVKQMDQLEAMHQALIYEERSGLDLGEFMKLKDQVSLPELQPWLKTLLTDYETLRSRKSTDFTIIFVSGMFRSNSIKIQKADASQEDPVSVKEHNALSSRRSSISTISLWVISYETKQNRKTRRTKT